MEVIPQWESIVKGCVELAKPNQHIQKYRNCFLALNRVNHMWVTVFQGMEKLSRLQVDREGNYEL